MSNKTPEETKPEYVKVETSVNGIDCKSPFEQLDFKSKLYAYYLSRASWSGAKVNFFQRSHESAPLFYLFSKIFMLESMASLKEKFTGNSTWENLTAYVAGLYVNCGNYYGFGDNKFIPEIPEDQLFEWVKKTNFYSLNPEACESIWAENKTEMYSYKAPFAQLGHYDQDGKTGYYSDNCSEANVKFVLEFAQSRSMLLENTFLVKQTESYYTILVVSSEKHKSNQKSESFEWKGVTIEVQFGFLGSFMDEVSGYMTQARLYSSNDNQKNMITEYTRSFDTGSLNAHKESQKHWIKDKGPIIETNIGFVETYLDPQGVRAEWEGFVAVVDQEQSKLLSNLVDHAEEINKKLPWPTAYEKDEFSRPDFTSLDILAFAGSGVPIGINIPNYDDIRNNFGFKNVNLGNVMGSRSPSETLHVQQDDLDKLEVCFGDSLFADVSCHELLGHGSGKLFMEKEDGTLNFDPATTINPFTGKSPASWYKKGETWQTVFGELSSGWEECRAECIALYDACLPEVEQILLPGKEANWKGIMETTWVMMVWGGLRGMMLYNPEAKKWGQAHCRARFFIFKWLHKKGFVEINRFEREGKPYFDFSMKKDKIMTEGYELIGDALKHMQVMKAEANVTEGKPWFEEWTTPDASDLELRDIVLAWRKPRAMVLQPETELRQGDVAYVSYEATFEGVILSNLAHYQYNFDNVYVEYQKWKNLFRRK